MTFLTDALASARELRQQLARGDGEISEPELNAIVRLAGLSNVAAEMASVDRLLAFAARAQSTSRPWVADFFELQRVSIAIAEGRFADAREQLRSITTIGPIDAIDDSPRGLARWETSLQWPIEKRDGLLAHAYFALANISNFCGAYVSAGRFAERGVDRARAARKEQDVIGALQLARAEAEMACGRFPSAQRLIDRADDDPAKWPILHRSVLRLNARLSFLRGDPGAALRYCSTALAIAEQLGLRGEANHLRLDLAELRVSVNQFADARALAVRIDSDPERDPLLFERARRILAFIDSGNAHAVNTPLSVTEAQMVDEPEPRPEIHAETASDRRRTNRDWSHFESFELSAFEFRKSLNAPSIERLLGLKRRFEDDESPLIRARLRFLEGLYDYALARRDGGISDPDLIEKASSSFGTATSEFAAMGALPDLYDARRWLAWCAYHRGQPDRHRELQLENALLAESMAQSLSLTDRITFFFDRWSGEEEQLAAGIDRMTARLRAMRGPLWLRRIRLWPELNRVLDRLFGLKSAFSRYSLDEDESEDLSTSTPLLRRVIRSPRRLTIVITALPTKTLVLYLGFGRMEYDVRKEGRREIRECVARWHAGRPNRAAALELSSILGFDERLSRLPARIKSLTIVPDDALHGFPFAVLPITEETLLIERFAISIASQTESICRSIPVEKVEAAVIGVDQGGPDEDVIDHLDELRSVAGRFMDHRQVRVLHNDEATPEEVGRAWGASNFVHIVCHGRFAPDAPDKTGIVLSDGRGGTSLMSLAEISRIDLRRLRHATVMACWTADAYIRPGRWTSSVPDIFYRSGAQSVIAPLWQVESRVTGFLVERLYMYLSRLPRDQALQRTLCDARANDDFVDESQWAAFQLYGAHQRLRLRGFDA